MEDAGAAHPSRSWWRWLPTVALGLCALLIWDLLVRTGTVEEIILPYPSDVIIALVELLQSGTFWGHLGVTALETLTGFAVGSLIGFGLGSLLGMSKRIRKALFFYVVAFQGLPKVVLAPIFVTAFGFGLASKIAMAVVLAFFPVLINTMAGIMNVDIGHARLFRVYGASPWQSFRKLTLPGAAPLIFAGLKTSLTFALIGAIVGEFVGASEGLGYLLHTYSYQLRVPEVWAIMVSLALFGILLYAIIEYADRRIIFWRTEHDFSLSA